MATRSATSSGPNTRHGRGGGPGPGTVPKITTHPTSQTLTASQTATFSAASSGAPTPAVRWQRSTNGGVSFTNIAGAASSTLTLTGTTPAMNGYRYRAVFTNSPGSATINAATLTVTPPG
ncbi:MAG: immunoglobulin domain-containing protein [Solirubrobacteraceae bacterium]